MSTALISLASSIVGGCLVLLGQLLSRRNEDKRHWQTILHAAPAEVATSFAQERAQFTLDRARRVDVSVAAETTYVVDRQRALGKLRTLPKGDRFEPELKAMGAAIEGCVGTPRRKIGGGAKRTENGNCTLSRQGENRTGRLSAAPPLRLRVGDLRLSTTTLVRAVVDARIQHGSMHVQSSIA